jgi:glucosamine-phosphate N-acetyltransferase
MEPETIIIRPAQAADVSQICELVNLLSPKAGNYQDADRAFEYISGNRDYALYVAVLGAKVVGTAMCHLQHKLSYNCGCAAHLEDVVVDPACRGRGVGRALVQAAIDFARTSGCYKIMLTCWETTGSVQYYESLGFVRHDVGMRMSLKEEYPLSRH